MFKELNKIIIFASALIELASVEAYLPILFWHSAGESYNGEEATLYTELIRTQVGQDIYIKSFSLNDVGFLDLMHSLTVHPFDQVR